MEGIISWLLSHVGVIVFLVVAVSAVRNMIRVARRGQEGGAAAPRRALSEDDDPEAAERTRRVQEEIRRKIAERRASAAEAEAAATREMVSGQPRPLSERLPPLVRPTRVPPLDPFGGPMRKIVRKMEEAAETASARLEPDEEAETKAALERQRKLADELRALEAARKMEEQRAAAIAAMQRAEEPGLAISGRRDLREQLRDPQELRRAVVLREILGAPVGLR